MSTTTMSTDAALDALIRRAFAVWVQGYRAQAGISQQALADILGLSRQQIIRYEQARTTPQPAVIMTAQRELDPDIWATLSESVAELEAQA